MLGRLLSLAIVASLCACTTGPTPPPSPVIPVVAKAVVLEKYGAGGQSLSSAMGPGAGTFGGRMQARFGSAVYIVGYYQWTDNVSSVIASVPATAMVMMFGDSCGASAVPYDAAGVSRSIALIGGFQPSIYCGNGGGFTEPVPANVQNAIEVYNPTCVDTGGLGCRLWTLAPSFPASRLTIVQRPDLHPGVNVDSENDMLDKMAMVLQGGPQLKGAPRRGGQPHVVVRHHGERL